MTKKETKAHTSKQKLQTKQPETTSPSCDIPGNKANIKTVMSNDENQSKLTERWQRGQQQIRQNRHEQQGKPKQACRTMAARNITTNTSQPQGKQ